MGGGLVTKFMWGIVDITKKKHKKLIFIPSLYFNNTQYNDNQRYLGLFLDEKLSLLEHIDIKTKKVRIGVKLIRKLKSFITKFVLAGNL